jgi:cytochrome c oxidase subunit II
LSGGGSEGSMAQQGEKLFQQYGCSSCHLLDEQGRCPIMRGVYGSRVQLEDGRTVLADDAYIRESILDPNAKIVAGFHRDIMPNFTGQISEEGLLQLIVYIKSLAINKAPSAGGPAPVPAGKAAPKGLAPPQATPKPIASLNTANPGNSQTGGLQ